MYIGTNSGWESGNTPMSCILDGLRQYYPTSSPLAPLCSQEIEQLYSYHQIVGTKWRRDSCQYNNHVGIQSIVKSDLKS